MAALSTIDACKVKQLMCVVLLQKIPLRQQVRQLKDCYDDLREQIEDLRLDVDGTHEIMEEHLKEFMDKVAEKLDEMGKKICKLELKVKGNK
jgi:uncharacterized coiled-coil DUF342 family protein